MPSQIRECDEDLWELVVHLYAMWLGGHWDYSTDTSIWRGKAILSLHATIDERQATHNTPTLFQYCPNK